jgi:hypothetical protein
MQACNKAEGLILTNNRRLGGTEAPTMVNWRDNEAGSKEGHSILIRADLILASHSHDMMDW